MAEDGTEVSAIPIRRPALWRPPFVHAEEFPQSENTQPTPQ